MENQSKIPSEILKKSSSSVKFYEIQALNFPVSNINIDTYMLCEPDDIEERQNIFRDIYSCPQLLEKYEKLSEQIEGLSAFFTRYGGDDDNSETIVYSLVKMQSFTEIIDYIASDLFPLTENKSIKAKNMVDFITACVSIHKSEMFNNIKNCLNNLDTGLMNIKSITLGLNLDAQFQVTEIGIASFNTSPYVGGGIINSIFRDENPDDRYKCIASLGVKETKKLLGRSTISINNELFGAMNTVFKSLLKKMRRDIVNSFKQDAFSIINIGSDLSFIIHASRYMMSVKNHGGNLVFPRMSDKHCIRNLYNPKLFDKTEGSKIVTNDVEIDENNRIFVLTGPNSGGKSVYINSIGIAQMFFQLGMPVPASDAEMKPFRMLATIYVTNTDKLNGGRLANEVTRIKECLQNISDSSLILLDETFSSTSAFEGVFLAESLIKYLSNRGCCAVYVTHFHELSQRIIELNNGGKYKIHMMTAQNIDGRRTFKIVPYDGFESETSLAKDIVIENGLGFLFE